MELSKSELANILNIHEEFLSFYEGLWSIDDKMCMGIAIPKKLVKDGKLIVKFGNVNCYFNCSNLNLISLEGCPITVNGSFYCHTNKLTSLKYFPKYTKYHFYCYNNNITHIPDDIDMTKLCLYKNPYYYFKKFNYLF